MASIIYNGKAIIPAPFLSREQELTNTRSGEPLSAKNNIILKGKLVAHKGSPDSNGNFWTAGGYPPDETIASAARLRSILVKQDALRSLFSQQNGLLEVVSPDGIGPKKFVVRSPKISFVEGNWHDSCEYTVTMEAFDPSSEAIPVDSVTDSWNLESLDEKKGTYRLSHSVSASARTTYDEAGAVVKKGWEHARDYALTRIGLGLRPERMSAPGVLDATNLQAFDYIRTQQLDEQEGSFTVAEHWVCYDPQGGAAAIEEYNVNVRTTEDWRTTVTIDGNITGLEVRDNTTHALISTRYDNAKARWAALSANLLSIAEEVSGKDLHNLPINRSQGSNPINGTITFQYEYNDRRTPRIPNSRSETVTVSDQGPGAVFASIPIPGRQIGPILQDMKTTTARKRTISIEAQMPVSTRSFQPTRPDTDELVLSYLPVATTLFVESDNEQWNPDNGRYSRNISVTWQ
jgi:hypothetical protein